MKASYDHYVVNNQFSVWVHGHDVCLQLERSTRTWVFPLLDREVEVLLLAAIARDKVVTYSLPGFFDFISDGCLVMAIPCWRLHDGPVHEISDGGHFVFLKSGEADAFMEILSSAVARPMGGEAAAV